MAHRLRITMPAKTPTTRLMTMAARASEVVIGPRGVH
jgi:hypothetical protein